MNMAILSKIIGPACPHCGCRHTERVNTGSRWGVSWGGEAPTRRKCRYCGRQFNAVIENEPVPDQMNEPIDDLQTPEPEVITPIIHHVHTCPACGSKRTRITRTVRPTRYHKCKDCGHNFKSFEPE